jgi:DNA-binding PucR family transcriptional regulator
VTVRVPGPPRGSAWWQRVPDLEAWGSAQGRDIAERVAADRQQDAVASSVEALTVQAVLAVTGVASYRAGLPEPVAGVVDTCVQQGIAASRMMNAFRHVHQLLADVLLEAVCHYGEPERLHEELRATSGLLHQHMNEVAAELVEAYRLAFESWRVSAAAERTALVDAILAGEPVDTEDASRVLQYPLLRRHLALVVVRRPGSGARESLRTVVRRWVEQLGSPPALVLTQDDGLWVWLAPRRGSLDEVAAGCPRELQVAVGTPGAGPAGFRAAHLEARSAARLLGRSETPVVAFADVALELLLRADPGAAAAFVRRELGALTDPERADLRRTLAVYLAEGRSVARAAARLHVARNTVGYRVNRAVELLGRDLGERRLELECALRLADEHEVVRRSPDAPPR